jgi:hypothetical protein
METARIYQFPQSRMRAQLPAVILQPARHSHDVGLLPARHIVVCVAACVAVGFLLSEVLFPR